MMLGAAHAGLYNAPPPDELRLALRCRRWNALPRTGGVLDQPAGLINRMSQLLSIYDVACAYTAVPAGHLAEWQEANPAAWSMMEAIWEAEAGS